MKRQVSTYQFPVGPYSIFNALQDRLVTPFQFAVYTILVYFSNWDGGRSHGLSYTEIAKRLHVKRPRVIMAIKALIEKGWLEKKARNLMKETHAKYNQNTPNVYRVIDHNCAPELVPLDPDGLPKKCAIPRGEGCAMEKMREGNISWQAMVYWTVSKIVSDWTTGVVSLSIKEAREWIAFADKTICDIRKALKENGLLEQLSKKFRAFIAQLLPAPYEKRRQRRRENPKGMRCDGKFYYSYNGRWRVSRETAEIHTKVEGTSDWRFANEGELERVNPKIYVDFKRIINMVLSPGHQRLLKNA